MKYTNLENLKNFLWISDNNSNEKLEKIIDRATNMINSTIWQSLEKHILSERVNGNWNKKIYLKNKANKILKISEKNWKKIEVDFVDWYIIFLENNAPKWEKNILVEYVFWFDKTPADVEEICLDLCSIFSSEENIFWKNSENIVDKNIKTKKLWELMITYFWETEKKILSSKEALSPAKNILKILEKYKKFGWIF